MTDTFGARLRQLRRDRGFSHTTLASRAGVSVGSISNWENDHRPSSAMDLARLARALRVSPHFLDTGEKEEPSIEALRWISRVSLSDVARLHNAMRAGEKQEVLLAMIGEYQA